MTDTSLDVQFLTLRNITAYNPDNSFAASGNVLAIGDNGSAYWTSTLSTHNFSSISTNAINMTNGAITGLNSINGSAYPPPGSAVYWSTVSGVVSSVTGSLPVQIGTSLSTNALNMTSGIITNLSTIDNSSGTPLNLEDCIVSINNGNLSVGPNPYYISTNTLNMTTGKIAGLSEISNSFYTLGSVDVFSGNLNIKSNGHYVSTNVINMTSGDISGLSSINGSAYPPPGSAVYWSTVSGSLSSITGNPVQIGTSLSTNTLTMTNGDISGLSSITGLSSINGVKYDPTNDVYWSTVSGSLSSITGNPIKIGTSLSTNLLTMTNGDISGLSTIHGTFSTLGSIAISNSLTTSTLNVPNTGIISTLTVNTINGQIYDPSNDVYWSTISGVLSSITGTNPIQIGTSLSTNIVNMTNGDISGLSTINGSPYSPITITSLPLLPTISAGISTQSITLVDNVYYQLYVHINVSGILASITIPPGEGLSIILGGSITNERKSVFFIETDTLLSVYQKGFGDYNISSGIFKVSYTTIGFPLTISYYLSGGTNLVFGGNPFSGLTLYAVRIS